ncbi:MAG: DNRLRE domain-containing protein, partial [Minicystis sp.]
MSVAGWVVTALVSTLAMGISGASGCGDTIDSKGQTETAGQHEALGEAQQAANVTATKCIVLNSVNGAHNSDTMISREKPDDNYGTSAFAFASGGTTTNPALPQMALFKFDLSAIPAGATIVSAGFLASQTNNGTVTGNLHRITSPWDELTVTWNSFNAGYLPQVFTTYSTASATINANIQALMQGWINGTFPNQGVLLEQPGAPVTKWKTREFVLAGQQPQISTCYKVICAAGTADCDNDPTNGCETNTNAPGNCGGCGVVCPNPANAAATCPAGVCALGACNLGFANCDANAANGCEANLTSNGNCGACGAICDLPNASESCASGTCKVVTCNAGSYDCNGNNLDGCELTPCADGSHCGQGSDCASHVCVGGFCASAACNDHAKNGNETDVDCGGSCPPCVDGDVCVVSGDCQSGVCSNGTCITPTCTDGAKNGSETDVDCGGLTCAPCADTKGCGFGGDCQSGVCLGGVCQAATCGDGLKNGSETGVDCGGTCAPCANGAGCLVAADCNSGVCSNGVCQIPNCGDAVKNGNETDTDCGGTCPPCNPNQGCGNNSDCNSGVCVNNHCQPPTCTDGVKNGNETGVDCGGACFVPEQCDGVDNDCNGSIDEGLGSTTCGIGACQVTVQNCVNAVTQVCVAGAPAAQEDCEGHLDDDCDGVIDNGCACVNGTTKPCYTGSAATENVGICHGGTTTCALGQWGACANEVTPAAEICDSKDNDCNGQTDEDLGSTICGIGACQAMVQNCVGGVTQVCSAGAPTAEICDGIDNDCDGQVDEDQPMINCGVGACATTVPSCVAGVPNACDPHATDGVACDDSHDCTMNDACSNGLCTGANKPAGTACRASTGACDPAETCTGAAADCPADALAAAGTPCRAAAGVCDAAETCTGASAACPADGKVAAGTTCRASAGVCDVAESCDGASDACPANAFLSAATECRAAGGVCDVAESCTGASA